VPFDVTTFGEALLRLSVPEGIRLQVATKLDLHVAGAECNIASLLARIGRRSAYHSVLPRNPLGHLVADHLRKAGVNLDGIIWQETGRVGTFYVEFSVPPRATQVIYDRADSCITRVNPDMINWDALLDTRLLHLTGITPALTPACYQTVQEIIARARAAGILISFDVNYRAKLWSEADARAGILPLIQEIDLLFCGQNDARRVFGIEGKPEAIVAALAEQTKAKQIVVSLGNQGAIGWDGTNYIQQPAVPVQIIDRIGAGDALAVGVMHGWLDGDLALGLRYGVTLAGLAISQHGDAVITTPEEVAALLTNTSVAGLVQR
jgi:2-dehydro-3-deoxygluconokinase